MIIKKGKTIYILISKKDEAEICTAPSLVKLIDDIQKDFEIGNIKTVLEVIVKTVMKAETRLILKS